MRFVVAIDGPAAAGKGTIARAVADRFGFAHLDTGLLYRAVGIRALETSRGVIDEGVAELIARRLSDADLRRPDLRSPRVAQAASRVASLPRVRSALLDYQRKFAGRDGGAVLDGRDIGTVICPRADLKLFVTASDAIRAVRRYEELRGTGADTTLERTLGEIRQRDLRDSGRDNAPMTVAADAVLLDTSELSIEQAVTKAVAEIERRLQSRDEQGRA